MNKLIFGIKVLVLSIVLFFLSQLFIEPFLNPLLSFLFSSMDLSETLKLYITLGIFLIIFILIMWGVIYFLKKEKPAPVIIVENPTFNANPPSTIGVNIWAGLIVFITIVVPIMDKHANAGIVYLFSLPLLCICLILFRLFKDKFKETSKSVYKKLIISLLSVWSVIISAVYILNMIQ